MKSSDSNKKDNHLSHYEADKRMENMAKLSKEPKHAFQIENLRAQYKDEMEKNENDRIKARIYHSMGEPKLHQGAVKEVDQIYADKNQKAINKTHAAAKEIYSNHANTASNSFETSKLKDVLKDNFEKTKNTPKKEIISTSKKFNLSKEKGKLKFDFDKYRDNLKQEDKNISNKFSLAKEQDNLNFNFDKSRNLDMER